MAYVQSGSGGTYNTGNTNRYFYARLDYDAQSNSNTASSIGCRCKVRISGNYGVNSKWSGTLSATGQSSSSGTGSCSYASNNTGGEVEGRNIKTLVSRTFSWNRSCSNQSVSISASVTCTGSSSLSGWYNKSVAVSQSFTIPARTQYTVTYNANGGTLAANTVCRCSACGGNHKSFDYNCTLATAIPTRQFYTFIEWNTQPDGSGTSYNPEQVYSTNANLILYAQWKRVAIPIKIKVNDVWQNTIVRIKVNDEWVIPYVGFVKVNGVWRQIE